MRKGKPSQWDIGAYFSVYQASIWQKMNILKRNMLPDSYYYMMNPNLVSLSEREKIKED